MKYNFDESVNRLHTASIKWDNLKESFPLTSEGALPLWVADMDFACAKPIQDALHERINQQIYGYTSDVDGYYESVIAWFHRRFAWTISKDDLFYSPGVVSAIAFLIRILSKEGQGIIIQNPVYYPFARNITMNNRKVVDNPLQNENGYYTMNFIDLEEKFKDPNNAGMILCSPHNPVGRVWTKEELLSVINLSKKYKKWIIADEIHCDLIREESKQTAIGTLCEDLDEVIICTAPSKTFNLAGLQISNIVIHKEEYKKAWKRELLAHGIQGANAFGQVAIKAAYDQSEDWLTQLNMYLDENIKFATAFIQTNLPKAIVSPCQGTYLLWVDVRAYCADAKALENIMQKEANVIFDEGYLFGEAGNGFERINVACTKATLQEALLRMKNALVK